MIRVLKAIVLVILIIFLGFQIQVPKMHEEKFDTVLKSSIHDVDLNEYEMMSNQEIRRFLSLDPNESKEIAFYRNNDPMKASEIVLVQFNNMDQKQTFEEEMHKRIDNQTSIFEGYIDEEVQLLKHAIVHVDGNYALYVVGDFSKDVESQFLESIGE